MNDFSPGDFVSDYPGRVFVGRDSGDEENPPKIDKAMRDAWDKAKADGKRPPYRVLNIWLHGDNPLTDYFVSVEGN